MTSIFDKAQRNQSPSRGDWDAQAPRSGRGQDGRDQKTKREWLKTRQAGY